MYTDVVPASMNGQSMEDAAPVDFARAVILTPAMARALIALLTPLADADTSDPLPAEEPEEQEPEESEEEPEEPEEGEHIDKAVATVVRMAMGYEADAENWDRYQATDDEIREWLLVHPEIPDYVAFAKGKFKRALCSVEMIAYSMYRFSLLGAVAEKEGYEFWNAAADKVGLRAGDPVIAMVERFAANRYKSVRMQRTEYANFIFRTWNLRRRGESVRVMKLTTNRAGEFPIPDPI
jgi:hypothetical protein